MDTSVSSEVDEMPLLEKEPFEDAEPLPKEAEAEAPSEEALPKEALPEPHTEKYVVEDLRRIALYSEDGQESIALTAYVDQYGTQRIMLNGIDLTLTDFRRYFNCLTKTEEDNRDELLFVGVHASFITGIIMTFVALAMALVKIDSWA